MPSWSHRELCALSAMYEGFAGRTKYGIVPACANRREKFTGKDFFKSQGHVMIFPRCSILGEVSPWALVYLKALLVTILIWLFFTIIHTFACLLSLFTFETHTSHIVSLLLSTFPFPVRVKIIVLRPSIKKSQLLFTPQSKFDYRNIV